MMQTDGISGAPVGYSRIGGRRQWGWSTWVLWAFEATCRIIIPDVWLAPLHKYSQPHKNHYQSSVAGPSTGSTKWYRNWPSSNSDRHMLASPSGSLWIWKLYHSPIHFFNICPCYAYWRVMVVRSHRFGSQLLGPQTNRCSTTCHSTCFTTIRTPQYNNQRPARNCLNWVICRIFPA